MACGMMLLMNIHGKSVMAIGLRVITGCGMNRMRRGEKHGQIYFLSGTGNISDCTGFGNFEVKTGGI